MVPANHGWEGKKYVDPAGGDVVRGDRLLECRSPEDEEEVREYYRTAN